MDSNITNQQGFNGDLLLPEPHFDEEATVLSARPVVPLEEIKAEQKLGKRLTLGIAIIASLILGALGARFIYRSEQAPAIVSDTAKGGAASIDEPEQVPSVVEGAAGATTEVSPDATTTEVKSAPLTPVNREPARNEVKRQKSPSQPNDERELRQEMRTERRFERERERAEHRETRRRRSADGLSRIREIFEGPTRP